MRLRYPRMPEHSYTMVWLHLYEKLPVFYQLQLLDRAPGLFSIGIRLMFMTRRLQSPIQRLRQKRRCL